MTPSKLLLRPAWQRYGAAIVVTALVVVGRMALNPWWGQHRNRHLVLLPAVMVAAWLGGFGPGLLAGVAEHGRPLLFLVRHARVCTWTPRLDLVLYLALCAVVCGLIASLQRRARAPIAAHPLPPARAQIVAHDLRSPLTAIQIVTDLLDREAPRSAPQLQRIVRAVGAWTSCSATWSTAPGSSTGS